MQWFVTTMKLVPEVVVEASSSLLPTVSCHNRRLFSSSLFDVPSGSGRAVAAAASL